MSITMSRAAGRDGAAALAAAVLSTLLLAMLLPAGQGRAGTLPAATSSAMVAAPSNLTPALARLAHSEPARGVDTIVQMRQGVSLAQGRALVRTEGGTAGPAVRIINGFGARLTAAAAMHLAGHPAVRAVSLDGPIRTRSDDATFGFDADGAETAYSASVGTTRAIRSRRWLTGKGVGVAVIDTGIAGELPDFRVSRRNKLSRVRVSAVVNPEASDARDHYGHGTHIAGLIAGNGDTRDRGDRLRGDYRGVAPQAHLISIKASDDEGRASVLDVIYGVQFAVDHKAKYGIKVLNLSLSSTVADSYLNDPLNAAVEAAWFSGITVVAAAGNSGTEADSVSYAPGNDPFVITVGGVDDQGTDASADDKLAAWSSRGKTRDGFVKPEVLAPGAHMVSLLAPDSRFAELCAECIVDGEYFQAGGTSMATAVASGAVALLLQAHRNWSPDDVKAAMRRSARDVPGTGAEIDVDSALDLGLEPGKSKQNHKVHGLVDAATGAIEYAGASWRGASWRGLEIENPLRAAFAAASWRCDCSLTESGAVDPAAASWRAASWRTSFNK